MTCREAQFIFVCKAKKVSTKCPKFAVKFLKQPISSQKQDSIDGN
jgi:hypothetical protein